MFRFSWKKLGPIILILSLSLIFSFYLVPLPERLSAESSSVLLYRDGSVAHIFLAPDERWRTKVNLDDIDPQYVESNLTISSLGTKYSLGSDHLGCIYFNDAISKDCRAKTSNISLENR